MTIALASLSPLVAAQLGLTGSALYERQRALVRVGLLKSEGRRGPGSGVQTSSESAAILLISAMADTNLSTAIEITENIVQIESISKKCPLTGYKRFLDAMASLFIMQGRNRKIEYIRITRTNNSAEISYFSNGSRTISPFGDFFSKGSPIRVDATITGEVFRSIADEMRDALLESWNGPVEED